MRKFLRAFFIADDGPGIEYDAEDKDDTKVLGDIRESTTFYDNHTHYFDEIANRIKPCYNLRPIRHTIDGSIKSAHHNKNHHEEKGYQHCLLLRLGNG